MDAALVKAIVDLGAISKNVAGLKAMTDKTTALMAVVKANGYGHGDVHVARAALRSGASWLGVARFHEAMTLRKAGIMAPVLVFGHVDPIYVNTAVDLNITLSVYNLDMAKKLSAAAQDLDKKLILHLKVDTGMGRVGIIVPCVTDQDQFLPVIKDIGMLAALPGISLQGIYTHFAAADHADKTYTFGQIDRFNVLLNQLNKAKIDIPIRHAANSAGIIEFPQSHFDLVRAGISVYGFYPSDQMDRKRIRLFPAMTLSSVITAVRQVPRGFKTSYGMTYETPEPTSLASVPIGYADGFSRHFSNKGHMLVKGSLAPIVGRVCMDQTMIDVGQIPGVAAGDEVIVFGRQGNAFLSADEQAKKVGTIHYEMVSALTDRVVRTYVDSSEGSGSG
jgi:alanine racemase